MKIYLIGLPGVGKTVVGKNLAAKLGWRFIDLDQHIEKEALMFIDEIFLAYGEEYFRALETETLKSFLDLDDVVIACGGGIVEKAINKKLLDGKVILLTAPLSSIELRLEGDDTRPLLKKYSLEDLAKKRMKKYAEFKDFEVLNEDVAEAVKEILNLIEV